MNLSLTPHGRGHDASRSAQGRHPAPTMWQPEHDNEEAGRDQVATDRLVLWDIDHTLIETGGVGSEVFKAAFEQVTGHKIDKMADVTGRTEQVIFRETLDLYGIEDLGDYFPKFVEAQAAGYTARANDMRARGRVLPGAREALTALAQDPHITQTILTGNPRPSAEVKLRIFNLEPCSTSTAAPTEPTTRYAPTLSASPANAPAAAAESHIPKTPPSSSATPQAMSMPH